MRVIEGALLCTGFFLMASDQIWVVLAGIGLLALASFLGRVEEHRCRSDRLLPGPVMGCDLSGAAEDRLLPGPTLDELGRLIEGEHFEQREAMEDLK